MRKNFKFLCCVVALITLCTSFFGCSQSKEDNYNVSDLIVPEYNSDYKFMVFGDHQLPANERSLTTYKNAGFNTYIYYPGLNETVEEAASVCESVGLDMLVFGGSPLRWGINYNVYPDAIEGSLFPNYFKQFDDKGIDFNDYPSIKGFYFIDEPGEDMFEDIAEHYVKWFNEKYPNMIWHCNLLPSYATPDLLGIEPQDDINIFEKYINDFSNQIVKEVNTNKKNIGLDHYPLKKRGAKNRISDMYIYDLMVIANAAKDAGVDLSICIQSAGWGDYRFPAKPADIRLQVYAGLAFGLRRLEYYAYDTSGMEMKGMSQYGGVTESYYAVKEVNEEVMNFSNVYGDFTWEGVKTITGKIHDENIGFEYVQDTELKSLKGIKKVSSTHDAIIGQHKDSNGNQGFVLVNYTEPTLDYLNKITIEFDDAQGVLMYRGGVQMILSTSNNKLTVPLEAGEGVFIIPLKKAK